MGKPIWILSASLILLLALFAGYAYFFDIKLPAPIPLTPIVQPEPEVHAADKFDPSLIYEQDLFSTYIPPQQQEDSAFIEVKPLPQAPQEVVVQAPQDRQPRFVEPLAVSLTGIMIVGDARHDRAIIFDTKTRQEVNYKVGDLIDDAQLVAIYPNRVLLIRSNGQQEYLYLSQQDITAAHKRIEAPDWSRIVSTAGDMLLIDKDEFAREVKNIARFIDIFDLTSAYKNGICIGAKIGMITEASLPWTLGFKPGDIVVKIDNLPCTSTQERLTLVEHLSVKTEQDTVVQIQLMRNGRPFELKIKVARIKPMLTINDVVSGDRSATSQTPAETARQLEQPVEDEKARILRNKYKFASSSAELEEQERQKLANIKHIGS